MKVSNYILTRGLIAKLQEFQGPHLKQPLELENGVVLASDCSSSSSSVTAPALKAETFLHWMQHPTAITAGRYQRRSISDSIKSRVKATSREGGRLRETRQNRNERGGETEPGQSFGPFNQQHLVLLPQPSSSWTEKTGQSNRRGRTEGEGRGPNGQNRRELERDGHGQRKPVKGRN